MQPDLFKICADALRAFTTEKYGIKLKPTHAHELVAAYFGYSTKNAMSADTNYPISNLAQAEIVVMPPDAFIDQRRENLQGLSPDLPDSYTLGEAVYVSLFSDEWWASPHPPFRGFDKAAKVIVENNDAYKSVFRFYRNTPMHHVVAVENEDNGVLLTVYHCHETSAGEMLVNGKTTINLTRVAGRIGYSKPQVYVEQWTGGARRTLESLGVQL